jgi:hypothetical protein
MTDKLSLSDIHEYAHKLFKSFNNLNFKSNYNYALQAFYLEEKLYVVGSKILNDYQYTLVEADSEEQAIKKCSIACAKENGIVWHDLRKDPNDLPPPQDNTSIYGRIEELKQALLKCANENEDKTYLTGQVIISSICKDAKNTIGKLEKENEQLKAQIEKMKCCANCHYWFDMDSTCELHKKEISYFMVDCNCEDWEWKYKEVEE